MDVTCYFGTRKYHIAYVLPFQIENYYLSIWPSSNTMAIDWLLQKLERFISDCTAAAGLLMMSTDEVLSSTELPRTVLEAKSLLGRHEQHVAGVLQSSSVCHLCTRNDAIAELSQLRTDAKRFGERAVVIRSVHFPSFFSVLRRRTLSRSSRASLCSKPLLAFAVSASWGYDAFASWRGRGQGRI